MENLFFRERKCDKESLQSAFIESIITLLTIVDLVESLLVTHAILLTQNLDSGVAVLVNAEIFILFARQEFAGSTSEREIGRFNYTESMVANILTQLCNNACSNASAVAK